jgi:hypothetical protein
MSKSWEKHKFSSQAGPLKISGAIDVEEYPELSAWLGGIPNSAGTGYEHPPHTLTLWLENDMVHFCMQFKDCQSKCFGSFGSLSEGLLGVENALEKGNFSSRKVKK